MADDPTQVLRVYFVVDVSAMAAVPTEDQWRSLVQVARGRPLCTAIIGFVRASQNDISLHKRAQGTGLMKLTMGVFEIDQDDKAAALTILNTIAASYSVTGTALVKFAGCLQKELRDAAVSLGYTTTQANKLTVTVLNPAGVFDRDGATQAVQAYLATNDAIWHAAQV